MDHLPALAAVLDSPEARAVIAAGEPGAIVRVFRAAHGWNQQELADRVGWSQPTISRIEQGKTRAVQDMEMLTALAQVLDIPPAALRLATKSDPRRTLDDMHRRHVLGGSLALAVTALLPHGVATAGTISEVDIPHCWRALRRLHEIDSQSGGAAVFDLAAGLARRLQDALRGGSYSTSVGRELRQVTVAIAEQAGWSAHDAGWEQHARKWWLETCHLADLANVPESRIGALASMALQAGRKPGGSEAAELAQAATDLAKQNGATPKLLSLLAAREALGHAQAGDNFGARSAVNRARDWLDQGTHPDDFFWLDFYGPADLAAHETTVALLMRNGKLAETTARTALTDGDPAKFPRNHLLRTVRLGSILTQTRQYDEAIHVTSRAVHGVHHIQGSGRTLADLRHTINLLGQQNYPPAKTFATAAHRLLPQAI